MKSMKQVSLLIVLAATVLFTSLDSSAQPFNDGNRLVQMMREYEKYERSDPGYNPFECGLYMGYVEGVYDVTRRVYFNAAENVTAAQICALVGKYLNENPGKWTLPANVLVTDALRKAFPKR